MQVSSQLGLKRLLSQHLRHGILPTCLTRTLSQLHVPQHKAQTQSDNERQGDELRTAKPFSEIPGPFQLPFLYNLYLFPMNLIMPDSSKRFSRNRKKYGPIYKEQYGPAVTDSLVMLCDVADVEKLIRHDGMRPRRILMESWESWRDEMGHKRGILIENGPAWRKMRLALNKQMLRPKDVASYCTELSSVTVDFLEQLRKLRDPKTQIVNKLNQELFHWSLESIGTVLYERRMGGVSDSRTEEMSEFIQAVHDMFRTTSSLFFLPRHLNKKIMPRLQALQDKSWDIIFKQGQKAVNDKFQEIQTGLAEGREISGFLSTLLVTGDLSMEEIYGNISELMAAAVDTTSNAMQWVLYELCRHPDIQTRIREEVLSITPRGQVPTYKDVQNMVYLKGFLKEILRLYPVAVVTSRITNDDIVLGGYHIPPNVRVMALATIITRDPREFSDPDQIKPERWIRGDTREETNPYAWLAFGFGSRMCIGRRVAELEMQLLTTMLLQEFTLLPGESKPNLPVTRPLYIPQRPVLVRLVDRPAG